MSTIGASTLSELTPRPGFIDERLTLFEKLKKQQDEDIAKKPRDPIMITMLDGSVRHGRPLPKRSPRVSPRALYKRACVTKVRAEGEPVLWDLDRPLENGCKLEIPDFEILDFNHPEGKQVFRHLVGAGTRDESGWAIADPEVNRVHTPLARPASCFTDAFFPEAPRQKMGSIMTWLSPAMHRFTHPTGSPLSLLS
jgi:hypothetical protein